MSLRRFALVLGLVCLGAECCSADGSLRRPVALALTDDGRWLFTANRNAGTISVIDTAQKKVTAEIAVGHLLADLAQMPDGRRLLAVDQRAGELVVLDRKESELRVAHRVKVSPSPVSVCIAADGKSCSVASLWTRQISLVALEGSPRILKTIDLPLAPRRLIAVDSSRLMVADAFGGRLALVDLERGVVDSVRTLPAHNIRGLAWSCDGKHLLLAHQMLHRLGTASRDDIHWGNLLTNNLRLLARADVLDPKADFLRNSELHYLGEVGHGTADPAGITVCPDGKLLVPLAGTGELAFHDGKSWRYVLVGLGATAAVSNRDGTIAYVANRFADSVSIIDLKQAAASGEISLGPQRELSAAERGEALFHDGRLSHDGWLSCQSCHSDGHSPGLLADTLGDGTYGTPKRILSLLGVADTAPWAWNGSMKTLEAQVRKSIETTMHGPKPTDGQVNDLTAYLKTLPPPPSRARLLGRLDEKAIKRGKSLFTRLDCARCHAAPYYTTAKTYDVGLPDETGHRLFNPPSLRGITQAGPYLHDGRARTLEEVFGKYRHQLKGELSKEELGDLLAFLGAL
jgi:YVTN family beta-propeller protein